MPQAIMLEGLALLCGAALGIGVLRLWRTRFGPLARRFGERVDASLIAIPRSSTFSAAQNASNASGTAAGASSLTQRSLRHLIAAGIRPSIYLLIVVVAYGLLIVLGAVFADGPWLLRLLCAAILLALPVLYLQYLHRRAAQAVDRQLPVALDVMARSLQAGKSLPACWREMSETLDAPLGPICRDVHLKMTYGGDLDDILRETAARLPSEDVRFFFAALSIFTRTGGNLIELLRDQSEVLRQRLAMRERIRAVSAESRLSAWIMGLMPFIVTGMMFLLSPKTMSLLWSTPIGLSMLQFGLVMQVLGVIWIARLAMVRI